MATGDRSEWLESMSPYHQFKVVKARTEAEMEKVLNGIKTPFKIHHMYFGNGRHYCWISGDHRLNQKRRGRPPKKSE